MSERDYFVSTCLKAGSVASWGFSPPPPLIYTVCSEAHQGLLGVGVCFGARPRISAPRVGTATPAAPGGPVGHKTSRGLLALGLSSFYLLFLPCSGATATLGGPGREAARWEGFICRRRASGGKGWGEMKRRAGVWTVGLIPL